MSLDFLPPSEDVLVLSFLPFPSGLGVGAQLSSPGGSSWRKPCSNPDSSGCRPQLPLLGSGSLACSCLWSCLSRCPVDSGPDPDPWTWLSSLTLELPCHYGLSWWSGLSTDPGHSFWITASRAGVPGMLSWYCWSQRMCGSLHVQDPLAQCHVQQRQCIRTCWTHCEITSSANTCTCTAQHRLPPELLPNLSHSWSVPLQNSLPLLTWNVLVGFSAASLLSSLSLQAG